MKLQLNFQIVRFLNYKQRFSDSLPHTFVKNRYYKTSDLRLSRMFLYPKILHGRDAILRVRHKRLIFNILSR